MTFTELYTGLLRSAADNKLTERLDTLGRDPEVSQSLDMLLHPEKHAPVWRVGTCSCPEGGGDCTARCVYNAIRRDENGGLIVDEELCVGCEGCIRACRSGCLTASRDVLPVLDAIKNAEGPVYAMAAPAAAGQFGVSSVGKLRGAFKRLGFADMAEVALFADILTLKEALVFNRNIRDDTDFMLASCCCPVWIAMVRRGYSRFLDRMPDAVSPMIACGRAIKRLVPNAVTVFIGPCLAKKVEAREKDIADAVDFVLTFEELRDIFTAFGISPSEEARESGASGASERMPTASQRLPTASQRLPTASVCLPSASADGRIYGRTGGVSWAVQNTVRRLNPYRTVQLRAVQADGTKSCRALLEELTAGRVTANYLEGMGCEGGCVGGPKVLIDPREGRRAVESYADDAPCGTPLDNPAVPELLNRLGYQTIESLVDEDGIFTRHFEEFARKE